MMRHPGTWQFGRGRRDHLPESSRGYEGTRKGGGGTTWPRERTAREGGKRRVEWEGRGEEGEGRAGEREGEGGI